MLEEVFFIFRTEIRKKWLSLPLIKNNEEEENSDICADGVLLCKAVRNVKFSLVVFINLLGISVIRT